jgi:hypothetical protein
MSQNDACAAKNNTCPGRKGYTSAHYRLRAGRHAAVRKLPQYKEITGSLKIGTVIAI